MVKVVGYKERLSNEGKPFLALMLQGGVEIIHSATGNMYATVRKASVASTFDEETCKGLIGTEMAGTIEKEECEPYQYTVEKTGEILTLFHRYVFVPEQKMEIPMLDLSKQDLRRHLDYNPVASI
jgi:hypothetical protein